MKSKAILGTVVAAAAAATVWYFTATTPVNKKVVIPKNNDGGLYKPKLKTILLPGDTLLLSGDYAYINLDSLIGTPEKPIIITHDGKITRIGTNNSYAFIITNSKYFKIIGTLSGADPYGFKIGGPEKGKYIAQSFTFPTSDNFEITGVELLNAQVGFFANPSAGNYANIRIYGNYVHDLDNPGEAGRSEGVYLGNTGKSTLTTGGAFTNVEIDHNLFTGLAGDGIQVAITTGVNIHHNVINGYGRANLIQQRTAIIFGGCTSGKAEYNEISNGTGSPFQLFGGGDIYINKNIAKAVATSANEDGFYVDGKCVDKPLKAHITYNTIDKVSRDFIRDATKSVVENVGNVFGNIPPVPAPIPTPVPLPVDTTYTKAQVGALKTKVSALFDSLINGK